MHYFFWVNWSTVGKFLSGFLTVLIAGIAVYIAIQQFAVNRRQYRLALFEKRMAIFTCTMKFISLVLQDLNPDMRDCIKFIQDTRDHEFLFGPEVGEFITQVYKNAMKLRTYIQVGSSTAAKQTEVTNEIIEQNGEARKIFLKYMDYRDPY
jgi:hypothetical protein